MSSTNEAKHELLLLIEKIANLQKSIDQTHDDNAKASLHSEQDQHLKELKTAMAKFPGIANTESQKVSQKSEPAETGFPTV